MSGEKDHANTTRSNTGWVERVWIEREDNVDHLMAEMHFTEPEVAAKVLRGTYRDVSSGIPWDPEHGAILEHACITNTPFIKGLRGWVEASDGLQLVEDTPTPDSPDLDQRVADAKAFLHSDRDAEVKRREASKESAEAFLWPKGRPKI